MFVDSEYCVKCKYEEMLSSHLKKCARCLNWLDKFEGKTCEKCLELCKIKYEKYKITKGIKDKGKLTKCISCDKEQNVHSFRKKSMTCLSCTYAQKNHEKGKLKCKWCRTWRDKTNIKESGICEKCTEYSEQDKKKYREYYANNKEKIQESRKQYRILNRDKRREYLRNYRNKNPEKHRLDARRYHALNRESRREYSRYYYHNIIKPIYNKVFALQWQAGLLKERKVNRDGYWYQLNRALFHDFKTRPHMWFSIQNKMIKFMQTGKGRIEGDNVILDNVTERRKFRDYTDSDEGMSCREKPIYEPQKIKVRDYFRPD